MERRTTSGARTRELATAIVVGLGLWVLPAGAVDIPIAGSKLVVMDMSLLTGKVKMVFVAKGAGITKGAGTDPADISARLDVFYEGPRGSALGAFLMPEGGKWLLNSASVAKYLNETAPAGGAVRLSVLKPGSLLRVVGKSRGDLGVGLGNPPDGPVYVADTVVNGGETMRFCTQFTGCLHKTIVGISGVGFKLVCKRNGAEDPTCTGARWQ